MWALQIHLCSLSGSTHLGLCAFFRVPPKMASVSSWCPFKPPKKVNPQKGRQTHSAMGHNLWLHFGVDEHPFATYFDVHQGYWVLTHTRGTFGYLYLCAFLGCPQKWLRFLFGFALNDQKRGTLKRKTDPFGARPIRLLRGRSVEKPQVEVLQRRSPRMLSRRSVCTGAPPPPPKK